MKIGPTEWADRSGETQLVTVENAKEQLHLRGRHNHMVRVALDTQTYMRLNDADTYAVLACYQADVIERLSMELSTLRLLRPAQIILKANEDFEVFPGSVLGQRQPETKEPK